MDDKTTAVPNRVVDWDGYGWYQAGTSGGGTHWTTGLVNGLDVTFGSCQELVAARAPVRPVLPVTGEDETALHVLFGQAGRKTITTLAAALEEVFCQLREQDYEGRRGLHDYGWEHARRTIMAGRAGSWESALLTGIIVFGNGLNLAKPARQVPEGDVKGRRDAGPGKRVDKTARDAIAEILWRWVTGPDRYTEVAETLASIVSRYADETFGAVGWRGIADQWLQPGGLAGEDFSACYRLFYSHSQHYNSNLT